MLGPLNRAGRKRETSTEPILNVGCLQPRNTKVETSPPEKSSGDTYRVGEVRMPTLLLQQPAVLSGWDRLELDANTLASRPTT